MNLGALFHLVWPYALQLGGAAFAVFLARHVKTGADSQRALAIAQIAKDVAAAVVANNPKLAWLDLVNQVVNTLAGIAGSTTNPNVLRRAAVGALTDLGVKP